MIFKNLSLSDWKQFESIDIDFHPRLTVLTGANGSGKTTLIHLLARHFGWNFQEMAVPAKDTKTGFIRFFANLFKRNLQEKEQTSSVRIGRIVYSDESSSEIRVPNTTSAHYFLEINNQKQIQGVNILSHRSIFKYQEVPSIATKKLSREEAFSKVSEVLKRDSLEMNPYHQRSVNYHIKETLLNWAISGSGNKYIEPDAEVMSWYDGYERVLKTIMPKNIGFKNLSIRNYEIVLVTESGDFMLDSVSGGIAALIDLSWQIYNMAAAHKDLVVLIDEVENHLHASMQRAVLPDLLDAFPSVQFIVSTHSPLVVASVKDSNIYAFRYNESRRVYSVKLDLVNKARTASEILDEVLGVSFTMPIWAENKLKELVEKYSSKEPSLELFDEMRQEFKVAGLENLMPMALQSVLKHD